MHKALPFIITSLLASSALADRYWDVPETDARAIAVKVKDQIVVEYCAGCGDIVTIFSVSKAAVAKGDYSDDKQVKIDRKLLLSGQSKLPLKLSSSCGESAEHVDLDEGRLDIPYSYILEGGRAEWVGAGTGIDDRLNNPPLKISDELQRAIQKCSGRAPPPKVKLSNTTLKIPRAIKGKETRVSVAAARAKIGNKTVVVPSFVAAKPKLAGTFRARHGDAFVVELRPDGAPFGHVVLTPDPNGDYVAHIIAAPISRDDFHYDAQYDRVRTQAGRFVLVDDLNIREKPKGKVLTRVHRGALLMFDGKPDVSSDWIKVKALEGTEEVRGVSASKLVSDFAPLFDPKANRWRALSHAEAEILGLGASTFEKMRALSDETQKMKGAKDLCALIPKLRKIGDPVGDAVGNKWMEESGAKFALVQEVVYRVGRVLPALDIRPMSEGVPISTRYSALVRGQDKDTVNVLRAAEALEGTPFPVWMEQTWDLGGCTKVNRALLSVKLLGQSWNRAPKCLRALLKAELKENIEALGGAQCFCDKKSRVQKDMKKIAPHLKKLDELGGSEAARAHKRNFSKGTFSSSCAN